MNQYRYILCSFRWRKQRARAPQDDVKNTAHRGFSRSHQEECPRRKSETRPREGAAPPGTPRLLPTRRGRHALVFAFSTPRPPSPLFFFFCVCLLARFCACLVATGGSTAGGEYGGGVINQRVDR